MKRATGYVFDKDGNVYDFNPRPREEGDNFDIAGGYVWGYFNPRPREEGDASHRSSVDCDMDFNPRPREEGDASIRSSSSVSS